MAHTAAIGEEVGGGACAVAKVAGEGMPGDRALHGYLNRFSHRRCDPPFSLYSSALATCQIGFQINALGKTQIYITRMH